MLKKIIVETTVETMVATTIDMMIAIKETFPSAIFFGFTGTPIFVKNAISKKSIKQTTANLFNDCLHKYVITDAIRDENVLKFSIEYYNVFKSKKSVENLQVEGIDKQEVYESEEYINTIVDYILANHNRKTHHRTFTAMLCLSSVDILIKYYELLKAKKVAGEHRLNIATIFSYAPNPEDASANGEIPEEDFPETNMAAEPSSNYGKIPNKDKLDEYIADYNLQFGAKHSAKDGNTFLNYKKDISKRVKNK